MQIQVTHEVMEALFKGMLQNDVPLSDIVVGLHNARAHGEHIQGEMGDDDEFLGTLMDSLETALGAARKMEGDA